MMKSIGILITAVLAGITAETCAAETMPASAPVDIVSYQLKQGESLYTVGEQFFSPRSAYETVRRLNHIANPRAIAPGTLISVPRRYLKTKMLEAQIMSFRGDVIVELAGASVKPGVGTSISEGMTLQTGDNGFLTFGLSNGSRITLPSRSRIKILQMRQVLLTSSVDFDFALDSGRAEATVAPLKGKDDRFRLRTPIAVSAVRGTRFRIAYDSLDRPSLTEVTEGGVAVNASDTKKTASASLVPAGFGASASASGSIATEPLLAAPEVQKPGRLQKDVLVNIDLAPVAQARGYHVQLAADAGFVDMVAAKRSESPSVQFENIADGSYFVRAMAIAPSGLEGLTETYSMRRQLSVVGGSAAPLEPGTYQFKWLAQGDGKHSFRFQLLRDPKDTVPLVDEVGLETTAIVLKNLAPGSYFWRIGVRQFSTAGITQSWTQPEKIIVSELEK